MELHLLVANTFENYVNYAGSKTDPMSPTVDHMFENYVNYAGSKTYIHSNLSLDSLRTM